MNVLVIGLGSMGKRRTRLMKILDPGIQVFGVDNNPVRCQDALGVGISKTFSDLTEAISEVRPTCAFVCTSPLSHYPVISTCLQHGVNVFSELNLVQDGYADLIETAKKQNCVLFLSSTLLYRHDIQFIVGKIDMKRVNYIYHVGQYLPDWHPWESYKNYFVNDKRTNGCREIFAIELPWIMKAMGPIRNVSVNADKLTTLDLNYADNYMLNMVHENGSKGLICVDIVSRKAIRRLEVFSEDLYLEWGGAPNSLQMYNFDALRMDSIETYDKVNRNLNYSDNIIENAYVDEIVEFFQVLKKAAEPRYSFEKDLRVLDLIDEIERTNLL